MKFGNISIPGTDPFSMAVKAAAASGIQLPTDTTPQNLGIDLNAIAYP
jgi:hypothetical protein